MARLLYLRCSSVSQSVDAQRAAMSDTGPFDKEFIDEAISGAVLAAKRPGFAAMLAYVRDHNDEIHVFDVSRLGRDAIDVQQNVKILMERGVRVFVRGLGEITSGAGQIVLAVLAQVSEMERERIVSRCESGRKAAREALAATGRTHKGKLSLGRPVQVDAAAVKTWRAANGASIRDTARHFSIGETTVKRCMK
ncbi:MAG: recombinase family protein [Sphingomonadales bacterium]|nr:recombinase family protein [Sphingomonadales bacterium]MDE2168726.1 recombinase family protein [Sphingomonadales bacterium]